MIPTYSGLGTALSGLEAMQAGINTTSENIANASNPDYADESVNLVTNPSLTYFTGEGGNLPVELGTGVAVGSITRNDDRFIDGQYYNANANSNYYSTLANQLTDTEDDLNTSPTTGLQQALSNFYSAWQTFSNNPSAGGTGVLGAATTLAGQLNQASQQISTLQSQAQAQVDTLTSAGGDLDQYATDIAQLNVQIAATSASGLSSNSLQDQRAAIIDKLSGLANIKVTQQSNGSDTIDLVNSAGSAVGAHLVDGGTPPTVPDPSTAVNLPAATDLTSVGGTIAALAQLADTNATDPNAPLAQMKSQLDTFAGQLASNVNTASGLGTNGFFTTNDSTTTVTAANIAVNSAVTSTTLGTMTSTTANAVHGTAADVTNDLASFVSQVGNTVGQAMDAGKTASALLTNISNERQSVSGVSLDQEMTNLITYQQGYQASARVMNTMQSVIQTLISSVGGAGL